VISPTIRPFDGKLHVWAVSGTHVAAQWDDGEWSMSLEHALRKLAYAINTLANGKGKIKDRLGDATARDLVRVRSADLPENARPYFDGAMQALSTIRGRRATIQESIQAMSEEEAQAVANNIVSAYLEARHHRPEG
jgi:hypothetical protein